MKQETTAVSEPRATLRVGALQPPVQPEVPDGDAPLSPGVAKLLYGSTVAMTVLCSLVLIGLAVWLARSGLISIVGVDLNVVFTIQKVLLGQPVYTDPAAPPFEVAQYGPLFYLLVAGVASVVGVTGSDAEAITLLARVVAIVINLAIAGVVYRFVRDHLGGDRPLAVVTSAFSFIATSPWYFVARPDGLMALALLGALYCVLHGERNASGRAGAWLVAAGVLAFAAAAAKQNGVSAAIIVLGYLGLRREWRAAAVVLAACLGSAVLMGVAGAPLLGDFVRENLVDGVRNGVSFRYAVSTTYLVFAGNFIGFLALLLFVLLSWPRRVRSPVRLLLLLSLGWLFAFSTVTALKVGSADNYYNEFIIVGAVAIAAFLIEGRKLRLPSAPTLAAIASLYLLVFLPLWTARQVVRYGFERREAPRIGWYQGVVQYLQDGTQADPEALVLGPRGFPTAFPERGIIPQGELARLANRRGLVDYSRFREYAASGRIGYVIQWRGEPLYNFLGADFTRFVHVQDVGAYSIHAHPRLPGSGAAAE
jgi:hypothetical protein